MLKRISLLAIGLLCTGCPDLAGDCHNTLSCDPPDAGSSCDGVCAPIGTYSEGWTEVPFLFRRINGMTPPPQPCPDGLSVGFQGYASPGQTLKCPTCSCEKPTGMCALPETVTAGVSPVCPSDAGVPFGPASAWDGGCTANDAIPGSMCDGGDCVQSVTAGPMPLTEACAPTPVMVPQDVKWDYFGYACEGFSNGKCLTPARVCTPKVPDGFSLCVQREGDDSFFACPKDYPRRYVYNLGANDARQCTPCTCDPPEGSTCSSLVVFYSDSACTQQIASVTANAVSPMCADVPPGSPIGSKQAGAPIYTPGSCQPSGGEEIGSVQPTHPFTFCCQE